MIDFRPEDFSGRVAGHVTAETKFNRFVETCQFATRAIYTSRGGELQYPLIAVANEQDIWILPTRAGLLENVLDWVHDEAKDRNATWFFIAVPTQVGWYTDPDSREIDVDDKEKQAEVQDALSPGIYWHAAARSGSWYERRAGLARFMGADLSPFRDAPADQPSAMFDKVLA